MTSPSKPSIRRWIAVTTIRILARLLTHCGAVNCAPPVDAEVVGDAGTLILAEARKLEDLLVRNGR